MIPPGNASFAIQAPGGYGKSTLLRTLTADLLIDDAHKLSAQRLDEVRELVQRKEQRVIVAYRPWPRNAALAELTEVLKREAPPLLLGPLNASQAARCLGSDPPEALTRFVLEQTHGVPRYVSYLARAIREHGFTGAVPPAALMQFAADFEELDADLWRLLLAVAAGASVSTTALCPLLSLEPQQLNDLLAAARATGLLSPSGTLPPLARQALVTLSPPSHRDNVWRQLLQTRLRQGSPVLPVVRSNKTITGGYPVEALEAAGEEALTVDPALAAELFGAATLSGRPATGRQAKAAALAGDLRHALQFADSLVAASDSADRSDGLVSVAIALAHRGQHERSAAMFQWAGADAFAAIAKAAIGQPEHLDATPAVAATTTVAGAASLMARGVRETLTGSPALALSAFMQSAALLEPAGRTVLLPDSPAALAALTAIHSSELGIAESVLDNALTAGVGAQLLVARHHLLHAWVLMLRGKTAEAKQELSRTLAGRARLEPRDALFAAGLEAGIARRDSDTAGLQHAWPLAHTALFQHPVDLFTLLPLGELAIAAARLGKLSHVGSFLEDADQLLSKLGNPPLWTVYWNWNRLHASILAEDHASMREHLTALTRQRHHDFASVLASAAECWVSLLGGRVDAAVVADSAQRLHAVGLSWDGARLAGQAAIRTTDRRAMTELLDCARVMQGKPTGRDDGPLSEREQEVAGLVLAGLTYKQIGDHLFISAKTVEHHVARMRQRLNCGSRAELLARLRAMETGRVRVPQQRQRA